MEIEAKTHEVVELSPPNMQGGVSDPLSIETNAEVEAKTPKVVYISYFDVSDRSTRCGSPDGL